MDLTALLKKATVYRPQELSKEFGLEDLHYQYCLSEDNARIPEGWNLDNLQGWCLGAHSSLPIYQLRCKESTNTGWLIGFPILRGSLIRGSVIELSCELIDVNAEVDKLYYELTGSFTVIIINDYSQKVFLDSAGTLSAIYSGQDRILASSPAFVPYGDQTEDNNELIQQFGIPGKNNWIPFGLTPRCGVHRLLPNHSLDLSSFTVSRNWPISEFGSVDHTNSVVVEISTILKNLLGAIAEEFRPWLSLTAGMDSRTLLACAHENLDKMNFFTINFKEPSSELDCTISQKIAVDFKLRHSVLMYEEPSDPELRIWMYRIGCCANMIRVWYGQSGFTKLGTEQPYIAGTGSEVARGFYWLSSDSVDTVLSPEDIIDRLSLPSSEEVVEAAREWLDGVSGFNTYTVLDLLYIEQRLGCWASIGNTYANPQAGRFRITGFAGRRLYELMLSLPPEYRRDQRLPIDLIKSNCPDLLAIPFNKPITFSGRPRSKLRQFYRDVRKAGHLFLHGEFRTLRDSVMKRVNGSAHK